MKKLNSFQKILMVVIIYVGAIEVYRVWLLAMLKLIDEVPNIYGTIIRRVKKTLHKKEEAL